MAGPADLSDVVFRIVDQTRYTEVQAAIKIIGEAGTGYCLQLSLEYQGGQGAAQYPYIQHGGSEEPFLQVCGIICFLLGQNIKSAISRAS